MAALIAGLAGAFGVSVFMIYYNNLLHQKQIRGSAALDIVAWADDIYDRLITIQAQRDATFTGKSFGLSNDEYRIVVKEVKTMLLATKIRARVSLVYGEGPELMKFDTLHNEFVEIVETLLNANGKTWNEVSHKMGERFSNIVEPLIKSMETMFISGARSPTMKGALMPQGPSIYLPHSEKNMVVHNTQALTPDYAGTFVSRQAVKFGVALIDAARVLLFLALMGGAAWLYLGRPDMSWLLSREALEAPDNVVPLVAETGRAQLEIESPQAYGLNDAGEEAPLPSGTVLKVRSSDIRLRLRIRNCGDEDLVNTVFMLSLPRRADPLRDRPWMSSWQELKSYSRNWLLLSFKEDIKADEAASVYPCVEVKFLAPGEYRIFYKYFADNLLPQNGHFNVNVETDA